MSAKKWAGTMAAGITGLLLGPMLLVGLLAALVAGPVSLHAELAALEDGDPEYCLVDLTGIDADEFFEFDDGRSVQLDPAWCNISCAWYEAPLTETDLLRAGIKP